MSLEVADYLKDYWLAVVVEGYKVTSKATEVLGTRLQNGQEYIIIQWLTETGRLRNVILTKGRASSLTVPNLDVQVPSCYR